MEKQRNCSQWKEQDKYPERTKNETELTSLPGPQFKQEVIKMLKELSKIINRNADNCDKELETNLVWESLGVPIKIRPFNCQDKNQSRSNEYQTKWHRRKKIEKKDSDLEDRIMETVQSEQQTDKWKQHTRSMG